MIKTKKTRVGSRRGKISISVMEIESLLAAIDSFQEACGYNEDSNSVYKPDVKRVESLSYKLVKLRKEILGGIK